jgi:hypothetical protein
MLRLSREALTSRIRMRAQKRRPLDVASVSVEEPTLLQWARLNYGNVSFWQKALEAAGIRYVRPMNIY